MKGAVSIRKLLINEPPLIVLPRLAKQIGLNEAIILQQLHYWLRKSKHVHEGRPWIYNPIVEWHRQFPFFSPSTLRRTLKSLQQSGIVLVGNYNKKRYDKTKWYSIDYSRVPHLDNKDGEGHRSDWRDASAQKEHMDVPSLGKPIPETTIERKDGRTFAQRYFSEGY